MLPVVARKKGLDGQYEQADGSPRAKSPESTRIKPVRTAFYIQGIIDQSHPPGPWYVRFRLLEIQATAWRRRYTYGRVWTGSRTATTRAHRGGAGSEKRSTTRTHTTAVCSATQTTHLTLRVTGAFLAVRAKGGADDQHYTTLHRDRTKATSGRRCQRWLLQVHHHVILFVVWGGVCFF